MAEEAEDSSQDKSNLINLANERAVRRGEPLESKEEADKSFWGRVDSERGFFGRLRDKINEKSAKIIGRHTKTKNKPGLHSVK